MKSCLESVLWDSEVLYVVKFYQRFHPHSLVGLSHLFFWGILWETEFMKKMFHIIAVVGEFGEY